MSFQHRMQKCLILKVLEMFIDSSLLHICPILANKCLISKHMCACVKGAICEHFLFLHFFWNCPAYYIYKSLSKPLCPRLSARGSLFWLVFNQCVLHQLQVCFLKSYAWIN